MATVTAKPMLALALLPVLCWLSTVSGSSAETAPDLPAGSLLIAPHAALFVDQYEVRIRPDQIRASYVMRNLDERPRSFLLSFPLPDLDMQAVGQQPVALPRQDAVNFVGASIEVDGAQVVVSVEQRALALGLDVTETLTKLGLSLFPYATGLRDRLAALADTTKRDLEERGILRIDDERVEPAWTLKTVQHWRQPFTTAAPVQIVLTYVPIAGSAPNDPAEFARYERSHCLDRRTAEALTRQATLPGKARELRLVTHLLAGPVVLPGPIGKFRLIVEKTDDAMIAAVCRDGITATSPRRLEWSANDYWPDEDLHVLFAR